MPRWINARPNAALVVTLGALPFLVLLVVYLIASDFRLQENPDDKLLPALGSFAETVRLYAWEPDRRSGDILLWTDTAASLTRLGWGLLICAVAGLICGTLLGALPYVRAALSPLVGAVALVPPLAVLPILFIVFGLGEASKIALIVIGILPFLIRDLALRVEEIPREHIVKALTLGAGTWQTLVRVIVPQVMPRLLQSLRLGLGAAWLFLIAAEAIAADAGLGYRIFLVRRYLAMDVILPYVAWITLLAYALDLGLRALSRWAFPWYQGGRQRI